MRDDNFCHCGSCGHEKTDECYIKQCACCLTDHQGAFGKNKWGLHLDMTKLTKKNDFKLSKKKIQKILVPLDGSKFSIHALNYAINLAKFTGSKIIGIFVIPSDASPVPIDDLFDPLSAINPVGYDAKMTKQGYKILEQAKERCIQNKIGFTQIILFGKPGTDIVRYAESKINNIGLIIMGSRGHGHAGEILLGSVSYNVVHKSKKPVMIIK